MEREGDRRGGPRALFLILLVKSGRCGGARRDLLLIIGIVGVICRFIKLEVVLFMFALLHYFLLYFLNKLIYK